jgi:methyltransferase (TIGR00027 family)
VQANCHPGRWPGYAGVPLGHRQRLQIDNVDLQHYKTKKLGGAKPTCKRIIIDADLAVDDWAAALKKSGLNTTQPTVWIAEGLMYYILKDAIPDFVARVNELSAKGSGFLFDCFDNYADVAQKLPNSVAWFNSCGIYFTSSRADTRGPFERFGWSEPEERKQASQSLVLSQYLLQKD